MTALARAPENVAPPPPLPNWVDVAEYPFEHHWARLRAGWMHYVDEGTGRPVLFVHGTPTWSFEFRHLIRALSREFRCVAPDHLGFGLSERPVGVHYSAEEHAKNLAEFAESLSLEDFDLVVHDYGGPIGLPLALKRPGRVRRLVLLNTWMWRLDDDPDMRRKARIAGSALGRILYRRLNFSLRVIAPSAFGDRRKLTPEIHRQYLSVFPDPDSREKVLWALARGLLGEGKFYESLWQQRARLAGVPALIVWGMKDSAFRPHLLERWKAALPQTRVVELPNAGHWPHEEEPEAVIEAIGDFLRAHRP
ncbi:MAG TPA: alpha/beta fold hydrolase [Myxococcaceae bacterium]|nr:alpha/beta fold hydrolase [Myxococcaceae bacterium]